VCQASICWECNNIFGDEEGKHVHYEFDAEHANAQALLRELNRAMGEDEERMSADGV